MRPLRYGAGAAVFLDELVEAEVLVDDGVGDVQVRYVDPLTAHEPHPRHVVALVAFARLSRRPVAPRPPPGSGGRDVPALRFGDRDAPGPDHVEAFRWRGWRSGPERK